jgi:hypothetical protein
MDLLNRDKKIFQKEKITTNKKVRENTYIERGEFVKIILNLNSGCTQKYILETKTH